jgi:hypothetical protein
MQRQIQQQGQDTTQYIKAYFGYDLLFSSIASGASLTVTTQIQTDADFLVQALSFFCYDLTTNGQITAPVSTIQLYDTGSTQTWFDQAIPLVNVFGTGQYPFMLPVPRLILAGSAFTGTLANVVSTNAQYYMLTFHGRKLYKMG